MAHSLAVATVPAPIFGANGQLLTHPVAGELVMVPGVDRKYTLRLGKEVMVIAHDSRSSVACCCRAIKSRP